MNATISAEYSKNYQAELEAIQAATPPTPVVFDGPATDEQQQAATRKVQPRSSRRGASPVKTR